MKITADLSNDNELTLKVIKRLGYILDEDTKTKPKQLTLAIDVLQYLINEHSEIELLEIILKNKQKNRKIITII